MILLRGRNRQREDTKEKKEETRREEGQIPDLKPLKVDSPQGEEPPKEREGGQRKGKEEAEERKEGQSKRKEAQRKEEASKGKRKKRKGKERRAKEGKEEQRKGKEEGRKKPRSKKEQEKTLTLIPRHRPQS